MLSIFPELGLLLNLTAISSVIGRVRFASVCSLISNTWTTVDLLVNNSRSLGLRSGETGSGMCRLRNNAKRSGWL